MEMRWSDEASFAHVFHTTARAFHADVLEALAEALPFVRQTEIDRDGSIRWRYAELVLHVHLKLGDDWMSVGTRCVEHVVAWGESEASVRPEVTRAQLDKALERAEAAIRMYGDGTNRDRWEPE